MFRYFDGINRMLFRERGRESFDNCFCSTDSDIVWLIYKHFVRLTLFIQFRSSDCISTERTHLFLSRIQNCWLPFFVTVDSITWQTIMFNRTKVFDPHFQIISINFLRLIIYHHHHRHVIRCCDKIYINNKLFGVFTIYIDGIGTIVAKRK